MSNLTDLLPAGAGGKQVDFVATGTLASGQNVALKTDGTVTAISAAANPQTIGSPTVFRNAISYYSASTYDPDSQKIIIVYLDNSSAQGKAVVGTVSGNSISFGTSAVFDASSVSNMGVTYDSSSSKVVIAYRLGSALGYPTAIVGTVSGTSISFGTSVVVNSANSFNTAITYDDNAQRVVVAYRDVGNGSRGTARVGTVSGTSISFGTALVFETGSTNYISMTYDSANKKTIIAYQDALDRNYGKTVVCTVASTTLTVGSIGIFETSSTSYISASYDSTNGKIVIAYIDVGNGSRGTVAVGTVSGTTISFGTPVIFSNSTGSDYTSATYDASNQKVVISYNDGSNSDYGTVIVGTVSGTSISFGTPAVFEAATTIFIASAYDSVNEKVVISYTDNGGGNYGTAVVFTNASSNNTDFIGITDAAISSAASGSVTIKGGISTNVTGLTPNQNYYVQTDGTLSTTTSDVLAGKALSSTSINLDYTT